MVLAVKHLPANAEDVRETGSIPGSIPWEYPLEEGRQPIPVFLPRESHGQRSLAGCGP